MIIWGVMRLVDSGKYRPTAHSVVVLATLLMMLLHALLAFGQKAEYESYFEFRTVLMPKVQEENHWSLTKEQVYEKYGAKLQSDRIAESEIARRLKLLRTEHAVLDADFYSRYYLDSSSNFNHAPNNFLMEVVKGVRPGSALDYGMGTGPKLHLPRKPWMGCVEI